MSKTALVVADAPGVVIADYQDQLAGVDVVIAADGGARHLLGSKRLPDLAVGDFDSLEPHFLAELEQDGVAIERHPAHKDETDLELALLRAVASGATIITVVGALGGRPDQHLANLQLLLHPALRGLDVRLLHAGWEVFVITERATVAGRPGDIVSLLPMTPVVDGIVTTGLYYPLQHEPLHLGPARGVSNVLEGTAATIEIRSGALLLMHNLAG